MSESLLSMSHLQNEDAAYAFVEARIWPKADGMSGPAPPSPGGKSDTLVFTCPPARRDEASPQRCRSCRERLSILIAPHRAKKPVALPVRAKRGSGAMRGGVRGGGFTSWT